MLPHARRHWRPVVLVLALAGPTLAQSDSATEAADVVAYRQHVQTLANPFFEGRGTGSRGNNLAADYLEFYYRKAGLKPAFPSETDAADGTTVLTPFATYRQGFTAGRAANVESTALSYSAGGGNGAPASRTLALGTDYNVLAVSGSGAVEAPLVFAGYSIASAGDYATYSEDDSLDGKIAIVLRFEPMTDKGRSRLAEENGPRWSNAAALRPKLIAAADRGAAAIILVNPPGADDPRTAKLEDVHTSAGFGRQLGIPVVMMSTAAADDLVRTADAKGRGLLDLRTLADEAGGLIDLPGTRVKLDTVVEQVPKRSQNIGGILPGRGELASQFVIMGAHFDHVGYGHDGGANPANVGQLHPGADDNASGSSGILVAIDQLGRRYAAAPADQPLRSILFLHFSGEEIGLLGSRHFVQNSPMDAADIYTMINMDMIGRVRDNKVDMNGTGTAAGFDEILDPLALASGLSVNKLAGGQGPSDHQNFYNASIPVVFFFSGFHPEYHAPGDVADLINCEDAVRVTSLATNIAFTLAQRTEPLEFQSTESTFARRLNDDQRPGGRRRGQIPDAAAAAPVAGPGDQPDRGPGMAQMRVRFGIRPAYGDDGEGILVEGVSEGGSAAAAGVKDGDRMTHWNGEPIGDIRSWMTMMAERNPGDVVDVTVIRDGQPQVIKVTLKAADAGAR